MLHLPFRHRDELLGGETTFAAAYADFLWSGNIPSSLEDDIYRLEQLSQLPTEEDNSEVS
jgi:ATP-dependent DNA helicase PIF1